MPRSQGEIGAADGPQGEFMTIEPDDASLVRAAAQRGLPGQLAFEALVDRHQQWLVRLLTHLLGNQSDAEDVAQDAFLRAHRAFASLRDRDRFRAWLVRTAFRLALDRLRGDKRRARREDAVAMDAPAHAESVEDAAARAELSARVAEAVDALPEKLRIVTVLAAIQEQDVASVARVLDLPEGTVKSRLFLARKALAERLRCLASGTETR